VHDLMDNLFYAINMISIPRESNNHVDNIAKSLVMFKLPNLEHLSFFIKVMHKVAVLDNINKWKVFEDDEKMKRFLTLVDGYSCMLIDFHEDENDVEETRSGKPPKGAFP